MSSTLTSRDLADAQAALQLLLTPPGPARLDEWREKICRTTASLLGADMVTFRLPCEGHALFHTYGFDPERLCDYAQRIEELSQEVGARNGSSFWGRMARLGVWSRVQLHAPHLPAYFRSAYYNEFVVPLRGYDAIGCTIALDNPAAAGTTAELLFHHDRPNAPRFGTRGAALLRLLHPALASGVHAFLRVARQRTEFAQMLDTLGEGVRLHDADGRVLHQNTALTRTMAEHTEPDRERLSSEIAALAAGLRRPARRATLATEALAAPVARTLGIGQSTYRLRASYVDESVTAGRGPGILVSVDRARPELPTPGTLRARYALTRREAEVALLLAQLYTNNEVAETLCISPHTARHHTERVLCKLGIHSRRDVRAAVVGEG